MVKSISKFSLLISIVGLACTTNPAYKQEETPKFPKGSYGYDLQFLERFDSVIVLKNAGGQAQVIVSPKYQAKVFTSTAAGNEGKSFGWINYKSFTATPDPHMNAYGGENRLWLGPEGGPYSLFFNKGMAMNFANWRTPAPIDTEEWEVVRKNLLYVQLKKNMSLTNYAGSTFQLLIDRKVTILDRNAIDSIVSLHLDSSIQSVGYRTENKMTNKGREEWNEKTGMPCIWILDMFTPSPETTVVIPYDSVRENNENAITTNYFGEIPEERINVGDGILFFKADGKNRGKIGIRPQYARRVAGSYDPQSNVLTLTFFDVDKNAKYLNQEWNTKKPVFSGDAVNAYNDGPLEDGKQMGPFYEIESVSPAAFLSPGASLTHQHVVLHCTGSKEGLDRLAQKIFGISLATIENALKKNGN